MEVEGETEVLCFSFPMCDLSVYVFCLILMLLQTNRILGGIPTILPWWPIKPYRPCPNFIANGGKYSRIGQPLDEIAFGRGNIDAENDDF